MKVLRPCGNARGEDLPTGLSGLSIPILGPLQKGAYMNCILFVLVLIVLVALALIGQCDIRRTANQPPHVTQARQSYTRPDSVHPPGQGSASVNPAGPWNLQKGGDSNGLETDNVPGRR
jgi:hypothetical protein